MTDLETLEAAIAARHQAETAVASATKRVRDMEAEISAKLGYRVVVRGQQLLSAARRAAA